MDAASLAGIARFAQSKHSGSTRNVLLMNSSEDSKFDLSHMPSPKKLIMDARNSFEE